MKKEIKRDREREREKERERERERERGASSLLLQVASHSLIEDIGR